MGVIEKILSTAEIDEKRGGYVTFELNENPDGGIIHLQNEVWRIEMRVPEFVQFALCCVEAGEKLKRLKGKE
jgi:hypothetical protein|tara:strand:+ start:731 stop:946 length:216 start_codon:yes stop_codon:yes gene_type:complete